MWLGAEGSGAERAQGGPGELERQRCSSMPPLLVPGSSLAGGGGDRGGSLPCCSHDKLPAVHIGTQLEECKIPYGYSPVLVAHPDVLRRAAAAAISAFKLLRTAAQPGKPMSTAVAGLDCLLAA